MNQFRRLQPDNHDVEYLTDEGPEVGYEGTNMTDVFPNYLADTSGQGVDSGVITNTYMDGNKEVKVTSINYPKRKEGDQTGLVYASGHFQVVI